MEFLEPESFLREVGEHSDPVFHARYVDWIEPPGHSGGFSRFLVSPDSHDTKKFDFRISRYGPGGRVDKHAHNVAEHVYYFLEGTGVLEYGAAIYPIEPDVVAFVAPGIVHGIRNTSEHDLLFIVATSPPEDISRARGG